MSNFILFHVDIPLSQHHLLGKKIYSFPIELSWNSCQKNQVTINVRVYRWTIDSVPLIYMCILMLCVLILVVLL